jgi:hypothetical protein
VELARLARTIAALVALLVAACVSIGRHHAEPAPPFFGIDLPGGSTGLAQASSAAECRPSVLSMFVKLDSTSFTLAKLTSSASGRTPFITLEPWSLRSSVGESHQPKYALTATVRGAYDADFRRIAAVIAAFQKPVYLRFAHEMNGDWYPWGSGVNGNQPADYVRAWRHVHDIFAAAGAHNARWVWSPDALMTKAPPPIAPLYPGDAYVDFVGLTVYGHTAREPDVASTVGPYLQQLHAISHRPVLLSEVGTDGPGKASWIRTLGPYLHDNQLRGFVWFDTSRHSGATGDYRFTDTAADVAAFRSMLSDAGVRC